MAVTVSIISLILLYPTGMLSRYPERESKGTWIIKCSIDLLAVTFQISGLLVWPLLSSMPRPWLLPLSGILISCGWWENYVDSSSPFGMPLHLVPLCVWDNYLELAIYLFMFICRTYSSSRKNEEEPSCHTLLYIHLYFHLENDRVFYFHDTFRLDCSWKCFKHVHQSKRSLWCSPNECNWN